MIPVAAPAAAERSPLRQTQGQDPALRSAPLRAPPALAAPAPRLTLFRIARSIGEEALSSSPARSLQASATGGSPTERAANGHDRDFAKKPHVVRFIAAAPAGALGSNPPLCCPINVGASTGDIGPFDQLASPSIRGNPLLGRRSS